MRRSSYAILGALAVSAAWSPTVAHAAVKPHGLFTDGAVLQQGISVPVWGTAGNGEKVTVSINGQLATTTARDGKWMVHLRPLKAGGPYTMTIQGENKVELKNVLVGEVWICSGQSNMELPLSVTADAQEAIAHSADSQLHLLTIAKATSATPRSDVDASWVECGPETSPRFSAVAYYFGRDLRKSLKVPVGLIHTSWGGTVAEAWTSARTLESNPAFASMLADYGKTRYNYPRALLAYEQARKQWEVAAAKAKSEGREAPRAPQPPTPTERNPNRPSVLYNAMIAPLLPYGIKGAIWYQGESNAGRAVQYQTLLPAMIRDWRENWGEGNFPFLIVQLAPFMAIQNEPMESAWAELREAQRLTTLRVPNAGMAVITDVGEERDIHPKHKEPVGHRLELQALEIAYGQKLVSLGPTFASLKVEGSKAVVRFKHVGGGLVAQGGAPTGFTVAGADRKWHNASAKIEGNAVVVSSPEVPHPVAVRYGWANFPVVNLANKEGIPASPFRTDDFPLTTAGK